MPPGGYLGVLQLHVGRLQHQLLVLLQLLGQLVYFGQLLAQLLVAHAQVSCLGAGVHLPLLETLHSLLQGAVGLLQVLYLKGPPRESRDGELSVLTAVINKLVFLQSVACLSEATYH